MAPKSVDVAVEKAAGAPLSACHRWRPSWERDTISRSLGSSFKFNHNTQGWKAEPKAFPWSAKELSQFDPERQAKTEAWKRKARELEELEAHGKAVEELEAELDDLIKRGEAESSGVFPRVPSAKSCFPKPINSENTLNQELSSDEEDLLYADLGDHATQRHQGRGEGSAKRERERENHQKISEHIARLRQRAIEERIWDSNEAKLVAIFKEIKNIKITKQLIQESGIGFLLNDGQIWPERIKEEVKALVES